MVVSEIHLQCSRVIIPPEGTDKIFLWEGIFTNSTIILND